MPALWLCGAGLLAVGCLAAPSCADSVRVYRLVPGAGAPRAESVAVRRTGSRDTAVATMMPPALLPPRDRIHPRVVEAIDSALAGRSTFAPLDSATLAVRRIVLVSFRDTILSASREPTLLQLDGPVLADSLRSLRRRTYDLLQAQLASRYAARVMQTYWLVRAALIELPIALVDSLSRWDEVVRIEPYWGGAPPDGVCAFAGTFVQNAREEIGCDGYRRAGLDGGRIALFDTGIRSTHAMLRDGVRFWNCEQGACLAGAKQFDCTALGHGTASAAILAGKGLGPQHDGLTRARIDSYVVYDHYGDPSWRNPVELVTANAIAAFQQAVASRQRYGVMVAEVAVVRGHYGALCLAADRAFLHGALVVAAAGNDGRTLTAPSSGANVLSVGAYCPAGGEVAFVHGTTGDGRYKPDLSAPSSITTASNESDTALGYYSGTSGATPFVGGAALLLRNRMQIPDDVPPGAVYAMLMLCAEKKGVEREGEGRLRLPGMDEELVWGSVDSLARGDTLTFRVWPGGAEPMRLSAAIWWPETADPFIGMPRTGTRSRLGVGLVPPAGPIESSTDSENVFERAEAGSAGPGPWSLRIIGKAVPRGYQNVYWAARIRRNHAP